MQYKHTIYFVPLQLLSITLNWAKWVSPACVTLTSCKSHQSWGYCMAWNRNPALPSFLRDKPQLHSQTRACHGSSLLCSPVHYRHPPSLRNFRKSSCKYLGHGGIMEVEPYGRSSFPAVFRNSLNLQLQLHQQLKHSCVCPNGLFN